MHQIRPRPVPSTFSAINYSLIFRPFGVMQFELLSAPLNKSWSDIIFVQANASFLCCTGQEIKKFLSHRPLLNFFYEILEIFWWTWNVWRTVWLGQCFHRNSSFLQMNVKVRWRHRNSSCYVWLGGLRTPTNDCQQVLFLIFLRLCTSLPFHHG